MSKDEYGDEFTWQDLQTLIIIVMKSPGRLQYAETDMPLTAESLMLDHEAEFPQVREWYAELLRKWNN